MPIDNIKLFSVGPLGSGKSDFLRHWKELQAAAAELDAAKDIVFNSERLHWTLSHELAHYRFSSEIKSLEQGSNSVSLEHESSEIDVLISNPPFSSKRISSVFEKTLQFQKELEAITADASYSKLYRSEENSVQRLVDSLETFKSRLKTFQQAISWLDVSCMPLCVAWAWVQLTERDFAVFLKKLASFTDKLLYLSGAGLTQICVRFLPLEMAGDMQSLYKELHENNESSLRILLRIYIAFFAMQVAIINLIIDDLCEDNHSTFIATTS